MPKLTPSQELFWKTERVKKAYMKKGMTKQQALERVKQDLAAQLPETYLVGIEDGHITVRHAQNATQNMGSVLTKAFGGTGNALRMLKNIKKGFGNAVDDRDRHGDPAQEERKETANSEEDRQGTGADEEPGGVNQ